MDDQTDQTPKKKANPPSDWQARFLKALAQHGVVTFACRTARVSRGHVYAVRDTDSDFASAWQEAMEAAADVLEREAVRRATKGVKRTKTHYFQGRNVGEDVVSEYSDTLLMFLLKARRPEQYRERFDHSLHSPNSDTLRIQRAEELSDDELAAIAARGSQRTPEAEESSPFAD